MNNPSTQVQVVTMTDGGKCPEGGIMGKDYHAYSDCGSCSVENECRAAHDKTARSRRKNLPLPYSYTLPVGLFVDKSLNHHQRIIISLVWFRSNVFGHSYDKNKTIANLLGVTEQYISRLISELVNKNYLIEECQRLKRKRRDAGPAYRTSRKLGLGIEAVRLINLYRLDKDKLAEVMK